MSLDPATAAFLTQALAVALVVGVMLAITRRGGTALAGIATATLLAPTLVVLAARHGNDFARMSALGTLLSTPLCAAAATLVLRRLRGGARPAVPPLLGHLLLSALLAGLMSASVCAAANALGALGSGIVGGLPVTAAFIALGTRWQSGGSAAARYVMAYRRALWLRTAMTLVFGATVLPLGAAWALALSLAASGMVALTLAARPPGPVAA